MLLLLSLLPPHFASLCRFRLFSAATRHQPLTQDTEPDAQVSTNAFAVSSLRCSGASVGGHVRPLTHAKVAVGIYLAAAMLNHSCTPNALASFHGGEMRVVATRAIEEGEPVTISYGPLSSKVSKPASL